MPCDIATWNGTSNQTIKDPRPLNNNYASVGCLAVADIALCGTLSLTEKFRLSVDNSGFLKCFLCQDALSSLYTESESLTMEGLLVGRNTLYRVSQFNFTLNFQPNTSTKIS